MARARDRNRQIAQVIEAEHRTQLAIVVGADRDRPGAVREPETAPVGVAVVGLYTGERAQREELEQLARRERAAMREAQSDLRCADATGGACSLALGCAYAA